MKLLYVTSEAAPYAASGGLGDVMGALPQAVKQLHPHDSVAVILPLYKQKMADKYRQVLKKECEFWFAYSWRHAYCGIYSLNDRGVTYYFVDNEQYFDRPQLYGQFDDGERIAYFCRAVIEFLLRSEEVPDLLHANDWQSALTVVYLRTRFAHDARLSGIRTLYTIHNIEYQGKYSCDQLMDLFDLDYRYLSILEYDGCINLMKGAIVCADRVNTVSPNYASELREEFFSFGLHHIIRMYDYKISGIINGIDTAYFSPGEGGEIAFPYTAANRAEGKAKNKLALQQMLGLPADEQIPLIVMITRLTHGKGVDLVLHVLDELLDEEIQFVLLGTGEAHYEEAFRSIAGRHADRARAEIRFDRVLSKQMYAAADLFLMPSKSEPCGLAQMIACAYGTLPVVRGVGGLFDSIVPYPADGANGFMFYQFNAHEMLFTIKDALRLMRLEPDTWHRLTGQAMATDFTWKSSAQKYIDLYTQIIH